MPEKYTRVYVTVAIELNEPMEYENIQKVISEDNYKFTHEAMKEVVIVSIDNLKGDNGLAKPHPYEKCDA